MPDAAWQPDLVVPVADGQPVVEVDEQVLAPCLHPGHPGAPGGGGGRPGGGLEALQGPSPSPN